MTDKKRRNTMGTAAAGELKVEQLRSQRSMTNLDTLDEVTLLKIVDFVPVKNTEEALAKLGNNAEKLIEVINRGLRAEVSASAISNAEIPWQIEDEEGNLTAFTGTLADTKAINNLVLNMAKTMFGYNKDMAIEKRRAAKQNALNIIKNTEAIREALKATTKAALESGE